MRNKTHPRIKPITAPWSSSHPITERVSVQPSLLSNGKQDDLVNPLRQPINKLHPRVMFLTSQNYQNLESLQTWPPSKQVFSGACYKCILFPLVKASRSYDSCGRKDITCISQVKSPKVVPHYHSSCCFFFKSFAKHINETRITFKETL